MFTVEVCCGFLGRVTFGGSGMLGMGVVTGSFVTEFDGPVADPFDL